MLSMKCIIPTEPGPAQGYIWAMHPHGRMFYTPSMLVQLSDVFRERLCPTGAMKGGENDKGRQLLASQTCWVALGGK